MVPESSSRNKLIPKDCPGDIVTIIAGMDDVLTPVSKVQDPESSNPEGKDVNKAAGFHGYVKHTSKSGGQELVEILHDVFLKEVYEDGYTLDPETESKVALTNNDANAYTSYASNVCKEDDVGLGKTLSKGQTKVKGPMNVLKNDVSGCASAALGGEGRPKRNVTVSYDYQCTEDFDTSADSDSDYIPQSSDDDLTEHNDDTGDNDFDEDVDDYVQDDVNDYVQDDVDDYVQDDVDDYVQDDVDGGLDRGVGGSKSTKSQKKESNKIETTNNKECPHIDEAYRRQMRNVSLPTYSKKEDGHRDYRKTNYCYYCKRSFTSKIAPHYISIHSDEELVKKIILSSTESEQRKTLLLELENKGNFAHNAQVIERGEGELVVARRPNSKQKEKYSSADYLPCEYCLGFYNKDTLWLHVNNCCLKPKNKQPSTKNFRRDAKAMLFPFMKDIDEDDALLESFLME
ncbi:uncharacterized protein LOC127869927 [Dreissena polymorpha]|uniref:uncharacterized protein LOC127869927 n=1 Tax=Dreissena polymorpha TaxID=45954 RepID=UPI00226432BD|nr:uncharacterized protein LOC127869927 [Dreissena polymorpha]